MFGGVKMTLVICITIIVVCVLLISYNEYEGRYYVVGNADNSLYIFDKKNAVLNKCNENGCVVIETKLPQTGTRVIDNAFQQSGMFGSERAMTEDVATARINAANAKSAAQPPNERELIPSEAQAQPGTAANVEATLQTQYAAPGVKPIAQRDDEFIE
jgi:hypothetical protein